MLTITSCGKNSISWKEDVQLQDGRVITVDRYAELTGRVEPTGQTPPPSYYTIKFKHPDTGEDVIWEGFARLNSEEAKLPKGQMSHPHIIIRTIMIKENRLYILGFPFPTQLEYNCPNPPYILYEWVNNAWIQVPLENIPFKQFYFNTSGIGAKVNGQFAHSEEHLGVEDTLFVKMRNPLDVGVGSVSAEIDLSKMSKQTFRKIEQDCSMGNQWFKVLKKSN